MSRDGCVALPRGTMGLFAVGDYGISLSYSLAIFDALWIASKRILSTREYDQVLSKSQTADQHQHHEKGTQNTGSCITI